MGAVKQLMETKMRKLPTATLVEDLHALELYAAQVDGFSMNGGNVTITLSSNRASHASDPPQSYRVVVGRVVLPVVAARALSERLFNFLEEAAPVGKRTPS